ncbi:MAG: Hsp70 family protein, partial [Anaerolineae bacterium]|nr:Hsp70 family protein [Anaerolineae bacterium]
EITPSQAAAYYLTSLVSFTAHEASLSGASIGLSVPVEAFEHYDAWLSNVIKNAGYPTYRLIDEPSAAALGYGEHIRPGSVYLIFDFGGGTLHASLVLIEENEIASQSSSRCRVLGKAGRDIGGSSIDFWLYEYLLLKHGLSPQDESIRGYSNKLLIECEKIKEMLTTQLEAPFNLMINDNNPIIGIVTRTEFESLLENKHLFLAINQTIRAALNNARERGYDEDQIQSVLMIGGSSLIPSVQQLLRQSFGAERVHAHRPMDAIARGAARLAGGADFYDFIQHEYAIRYSDPTSGDYDYKTIIQKGISYPSTTPEATLVIKGAYTGQQKLGIAIFEISRTNQECAGQMELIFDSDGFARMQPLTSREKEQRQYFWMNEQSPTFIEARPPAIQGEARFEANFYVGSNKQLLISVIDLQSGQSICDRQAVITLS